MPRSRTRALAKQSDAVDLFRKGKTFEEIASSVGYANRGTAHRVVTNAFRSRVVENIDVHRQMEVDRLDDLQAALYPLVDAGNLEAIRTVVQIIHERSRILGLYEHLPERRVLVSEGNTGEATPNVEPVPEREKAA